MQLQTATSSLAINSNPSILNCVIIFRFLMAGNQVTVDHPQASFIDSTSAASTLAGSTSGPSAAKLPEPSTSAPQPQQVLVHQSKTAAPAHSKVDRHHVDVRPIGPITAISDVYMGTGMGGTVQGHLTNGASTFSLFEFPPWDLLVNFNISP